MSKKPLCTPDRVPQFAGKKILELGLPLETLGVQKATEVTFILPGQGPGTGTVPVHRLLSGADGPMGPGPAGMNCLIPEEWIGGDYA